MKYMDFTHRLADIVIVVPSKRDEFDVTLLERIVDHFLILLHSHRASRVDHKATSLAVGIAAVNGSENELLLQSMRDVGCRGAREQKGGNGMLDTVG
jgi:hypothetical protein